MLLPVPAGLLVVLVVALSLTPVHAAQITLKSGDVVVGDIQAAALAFTIDGARATFPIQDVEEWRAYHLRLSDGTVHVGARFVGPMLDSVGPRGRRAIPVSDIVALSMRPLAPPAPGPASTTSNLLDSQKESIKAVSAVTLQLIVIAVGVFTLAGTYLTRSAGDAVRPLPGILTGVALFLLGMSVITGYLVHGGIVSDLEARRFSAYVSAAQGLGAAQIVMFIVGSLLFGAAVWLKSRGRGLKFRLTRPDAREVSVVGTFNNWGDVGGRRRHRMWRPPLSSTWRLSVVLPAGRYEYLFLVTTAAGTEWVPDPGSAARVPNPYGGVNSVVTVV
jgi:hypothetical protein